MDKFVVKGIPGFDGDYPIDIGSFTMRELQIIKRMSGVRAGELEEAFGAGDSSLILAVCVIAVRRNGKAWEAFEQIAWESDTAAIEFVVAEEEDEATADAVPLTQPKPPGSSDGSGETQQLSGPVSSSDGDSLPEKNLRAIGGLA